VGEIGCACHEFHGEGGGGGNARTHARTRGRTRRLTCPLLTDVNGLDVHRLCHSVRTSPPLSHMALQNIYIIPNKKCKQGPQT
jgi:hypothetical protein